MSIGCMQCLNGLVFHEYCVFERIMFFVGCFGLLYSREVDVLYILANVKVYNLVCVLHTALIIVW